jgi:hypothetical protein
MRSQMIEARGRAMDAPRKNVKGSVRADQPVFELFSTSGRYDEVGCRIP